jgi:hypothetical protein
MIKTRIFKMAMVGLAVLLFYVSSQMQNWLNLDRTRLGLTQLPPLKNAPPILAFTTVALGGFRGLIANELWMRANDLQNDDKFFEMVQLADWITVLEPHFIQVWSEQSWNMAFNISVKFKAPEDRWHWVQRGIQLLRDQGLPLNPDAALLYRELSWLFQFKMGDDLDDAHMLYKLRWAQEMQSVVGGKPDFQALEHPKTAAEKERAKKLRDVYKMDPVIMQKVDEEYGPFDWRLPDAHAVYWAELYRQHGKLNAPDTDTLRRSIYQSLRMTCLRGGALSPSVTNVTEQNFMLWPNLDLVPKISAAYEKMIAEQPNASFQKAHKNFLQEAIPLLYINGRVQQATYWFDYMKKTYTNAFVGKPADFSLRDLVLGTVADDDSATDMNRVEANLAGLYTTEFLCLARDNDAEAKNYENMAKDVWNNYHEKIGQRSRPRLALKPYSQIQQRALDYILDPKSSMLDLFYRNYLRTKLGLKNPNTIETPPPAAPATPS